MSDTTPTPRTDNDLVQQALIESGVFKGANGLTGLAESDFFWEPLPYGKRLYYGDDSLEGYLHRDVLRSAIKLIATQNAELAASRELCRQFKEVAEELDNYAEHSNARCTERECVCGVKDAESKLEALNQTSK